MSHKLYCLLKCKQWMNLQNINGFCQYSFFCNPVIAHLSKRYVGTQSHGKSDVYDGTRIRNIGIIAHIDAGKTTTTERFLFYSGFTERLGDVDKGDTVTDYMDQERDRGITITAAAISFFWNNHKINLIDTPGHVDFTLEVERSLCVLDGAVTVIDASAGVEAQTLTVWRQADRHHVPRLIYVNKMDKPAADIDRSLDSIREKLNIEPLVIQLPIYSGKTFKGAIDLVTMRKLIWDSSDKDGSSYSCVPLDKDTESEVYEYACGARTTLIDKLADFDSSLLSQVLAETPYDKILPADILRALRLATIHHQQVPVLCGSSFKNIGVQPLLNSIINLLPNPTERHHDFLEHYKNSLCALAFKIVPNHRHGPLTFVRLYSGKLLTGSSVYNVNRSSNQSVEHLFDVFADEFKSVRQVEAGNIVAVRGLQQTITGDTLVQSATSAKRAPVVSRLDTDEDDGTDDDDMADETTPRGLAGIKVPDPVFMCSIEVDTLSKQRLLDQALANLTREDPSLRVQVDPDTAQTVLLGMGELHIDVIKARIETEYKLDVDVGPLMISYREAIQSPVTASASIDKLIGNQRNRISLTITLVPDDDVEQKVILIRPDANSQMDVAKVERKRKHLKAITQGGQQALERGPILNFPVLNARLELNDFRCKYGTSLAIVSACAAQCVKQALRQTNARLLQPMMTLQIQTDEHYQQAVSADITQRGGQFERVDSNHSSRLIHATIPLSGMFGYATALRTRTSGTASFSMQLSHYEHMSEYDTNKAIQQVTGFLPSYKSSV